MHYSAHTRLLTVMLTQTVGGREHSDLIDNIVLTSLRISRELKLGQRLR